MVRKALLIGSAFITLLPAFGQTPASSAAAPIPDYTLFRYFFLHVAAVQRAADALKAQGKNDAYMRGSLVHAAQLTNSEAAILNGLASSCNGAYSAESTSGSATVKQLMHQYPATVAGAPTEIAPQIAALEAQRQQIITACTASLQSQMGTPRFQMLYNFVSSTEGPRIKPAMPSAPPSGTIHPPPPPGTTTQ